MGADGPRMACHTTSHHSRRENSENLHNIKSLSALGSFSIFKRDFDHQRANKSHRAQRARTAKRLRVKKKKTDAAEAQPSLLPYGPMIS